MNYTKLTKVRQELLTNQKDKQDQQVYIKSMNELGLEVLQ